MIENMIKAKCMLCGKDFMRPRVEMDTISRKKQLVCEGCQTKQ